jgi:predicted pyridoxine 5'-phosphate oxidase superfamily flavin-nucleotide-binding protein
MRDVEKTIGNMIDKLKIAFLGSVDEEGFPNVKAMLQPRKREGIDDLSVDKYFIDACCTIPGKQSCLYVFL